MNAKHCFFIAFFIGILSLNTHAKKSSLKACQLLAKKRPSVTLEACNNINFSMIALTPKARSLPIIYKKIPTTQAHKVPNILILGGIHANEVNSFDLAMQWLDKLLKKKHHRYNWLIAPAININALVKTQPSRTNRHGVDINRNFPLAQNTLNNPTALWEKAGKKPRHYPGPKPFSEQETRIIDHLVKSFQPSLIIAIHAPLKLIDYDGLSHYAPKKLGDLPLNLTESYPGSLASYYWNIHRIAVLTIELGRVQNHRSPLQNAHLWYDLMRWLDQQYYPDASPKDDIALFNRAMAALSLNHFDQAVQLFSHIEDKQLQLSAKNNIAYIRYQQNDLQQARALWHSILQSQNPHLISVINNYLLTMDSSHTMSTLQTISLSAEQLTQAKAIQEIHWHLKAWKDAWLHSDKALYFSLYMAKTSPRKNLSYPQWKKNKITQFDDYPLSFLRIENIQHQIHTTNKQIKSTFKQIYQVGKDKTQTSHKTLIWRKHRNHWLIEKEIIRKNGS